MWHKNLAQHWNKTKSFIHQGYRKLSKFAGEMDRGAGIFKRLFSLATPMLEDFGQGDLVRRGIQGIDQYNQLRNRVTDIDRQARAYGNTIDSANIFE